MFSVTTMILPSSSTVVAYFLSVGAKNGYIGSFAVNISCINNSWIKVTLSIMPAKAASKNFKKRGESKNYMKTIHKREALIEERG